MLLCMTQMRTGKAGTVVGPGLQLQEGRSNHSIYRPAALKVLRMTRRPMAAGEIVECACPRLALLWLSFCCLSCLQHFH